MYARTTDELAALCDRAAADGRIAIDLEFIPERTYYPRLALIQLAVGEALALVDPLDGPDLAPLEAVLADPAIRKVLHAGGQDTWILSRLLRRPLAGVFDTQVAAAMVGLGHQISYAAMVERLLSVRVAKTESFTDWLRRPLTAAQEAYALDDVRHLLPCARVLDARLLELSRTGWLEQEMERAIDPALFEADPGDAHRRVSRAGSLKGANRSALVELARWRELEARGLDLPRRKVLPDEALVEIARRLPRNAGALGSITGLGKRERERHGRAILEAVGRGVATPVEPDVKERFEEVEGHRVLADLLLVVARALCEASELSWGIVGARADIEELVVWLDARDSAATPRLLSGWRREAVGQALVDFVDRKTSLVFDGSRGAPGLVAVTHGTLPRT